jgi:hypothetical protein
VDGNSLPNDNDCDQRVILTLDNFVSNYGLQPHFKPTLKGFVNQHEIKGTKKNESQKSSGLVGLGMFALAVLECFAVVELC